MGMFLSKYSMLHALGYGAKQPIIDETKKILDKYKLFGLILHDPKIHCEFHRALQNSFERLDFLTGQDFLFFALTNPPKSWLDRKEERDYFGIWETDKLLSPLNSYKTSDESISTYTISQSLKIDYDDLPVIILTNNFQFNQFRVIKTCPKHLTKQMTDIGYFSSQTEKYFSLIDDPNFNKLVDNIDLCGGSYQIKNEESLAKTLSDYLAFVVSENRNSQDNRIAEIQINNVINKFKANKNLISDSNKMDHLNLFLVGCLSNLATPIRNQEFSINYSQRDGNKTRICDYSIFTKKFKPLINQDLIIDERCENESKIILKTFNKVSSFFDTIDGGGLDYSILVISLCKIFEIETNLSIVHWFREYLNIEMPKYYKKHKRDINNYTITPLETIIRNPRPINFNKGYNEKWIAPGTGESELVTRSMFSEGKVPKEITDYENLLTNWKILRNLRNRSAHTENLDKTDFENTKKAFININSSNLIGELNDLKSSFK